MACQSVSVESFQARAHLTKRHILVTMRHIHRIQDAKALVCGVVSEDALNKLRRDFEELLRLLDEVAQLLISGILDAASDEELRDEAKTLQENDAKLSAILDGSMRIGLEAVEPFPKLLNHLRAAQERLQSQIEGIKLSLNDSFQELVGKSSQEINTPPEG